MAEAIWFWQRIISPHMWGLAEALSRAGSPVTYVAEEGMSIERLKLGWETPLVGAAQVRIASDYSSVAALAESAPLGSVHICQGFRGNGLVAHARDKLAGRGLRQWVILEVVEERNWLDRYLKRIEYARLIHKSKNHIEGVLAIGKSTPQWLIKLGMPSDRVFPFAYFLEDAKRKPLGRTAGNKFRFLFVGQLIERKRFDLLLDALAGLKNQAFEIVVVGTGPEEAVLRGRAIAEFGDRVIWLGRKVMSDVPAIMSEADCLVLPSRHDGWGAVVSEALMVGTPVICSDRCGVAGVVASSGYGGVFRSGDAESLELLLARSFGKGRISPNERVQLRSWARCLSADRGAEYLGSILSYRAGSADRPEPPWDKCA